MAQQPTYLLAPNFTFKPYTGPIALGNLIADPFRPHRVLTAVDTDALATQYPRVEEVIEYARSIARGTDHNIAITIWAHFLQNVTARLSGEKASHVITEYKMDSLVTEYFVSDPEPAEIKARIMEPRVRAVMKAESLAFRQPVYMVTGLKIAKGFIGKREAGGRTAAVVKSELPVSTSAGNVAVGTSVSRGKDAEKRDEWKTGGDIIFAYQLLKIESKGWRTKRLEIDEFKHKATYLSLGNDEDDENDDGYNEEVTMSVVTAPDLITAEEDKVATTVIVRDGNSQVSIILFPDGD